MSFLGEKVLFKHTFLKHMAVVSNGELGEWKNMRQRSQGYDGMRTVQKVKFKEKKGE